jgi:outer membrane protein
VGRRAWRLGVVVGFVLLVPRLEAQSGAQPGTKPAGEVTLDAFLAQVRATHPQVRQAELARRQADAAALAARGSFDPYVQAVWDTKRFKGIGYYDELDTRLVVPTPWGVDFKLGWERAAGQIINPERATPGEGLLSAGVSLPIGLGLLTDERRTARRQAEIALGAADADREAAIARVLQGAARDWGTWAESERRAEIAAEGVALARFRLNALRSRVAAGDAAEIDSVEAVAELTQRELQLIDAAAGAAGARLVVQGWLWRADGGVDSLPTTARPAARAQLAGEADLRQRGEALGWIIARHPFVQQATAKWRQADAQRRLAATQLLPSASVELSGLAAGSSFGDLAAPRLDGEESKFSGNVRIPLFARRELGRLRIAENETRALGVERERIRRDVEIEARRALIELAAVDEQLGRQEMLVALQQRLLGAEQQRFELGESSLLIVNLRERALLDERLRLASLISRRARALGTLAVALGTSNIDAGGAAASSLP